VEPDRASWTARLAASARAYHYAHDSPRVFEDFLADTLLTPEDREAMEKQWAPVAADSEPRRARSGAHVLGRARYNEDKLSDAIDKGISQYVIVGAGLDTFALRRPDLQDRLRVFELDHPVTQSLKRDRFFRAGLVVPPHLHFCPTDFERDSVGSSLSRSPFDPAVPTFFSWLGVTYYLTREAIGNTLTSIGAMAAPDSELVMDYADSAALVPANQSPQVRDLFVRLHSVGEPLISGFGPRTLPDELAALGFELLEDLDARAQEARYFAGRVDGFRPVEFAHLAHARRTHE
jgi:methyltransferase (TIGR00027 family)